MPAKKKAVVKKKPVVAKRAPAKASKKKRAAVQAVAPNKVKAIAQKQTQTQIISHLAEQVSLDKKKVKEVLAAIYGLMEGHVKLRGSGVFVIPELGIKVKRHIKPASKARDGVNPFTGEAIKIKAKPKRQVVKVMALKKLKGVLEPT